MSPTIYHPQYLHCLIPALFYTRVLTVCNWLEDEEQGKGGSSKYNVAPLQLCLHSKHHLSTLKLIPLPLALFLITHIVYTHMHTNYCHIHNYIHIVTYIRTCIIIPALKYFRTLYIAVESVQDVTHRMASPCAHPAKRYRTIW